MRRIEVRLHYADVAELADALDSGSSSRKGVEVQVLSSAPFSITYGGSKNGNALVSSFELHIADFEQDRVLILGSLEARAYTRRTSILRFCDTFVPK